MNKLSSVLPQQNMTVVSASNVNTVGNGQCAVPLTG
jgi:hypothetical protein